MKEYFNDAVVITADEVTEYFFALNDKEYWGADDYPILAPPFKNFWIETRHPSAIRSSERGNQTWIDPQFLRPHRWGCLFRSVPKETLLLGHGKPYFNQQDLSQFQWLLNATMFIQRPGAGIIPSWEWSVPIDKDGKAWTKWSAETQKIFLGLSYSLQKSVQRLVPTDVEKYEGYRHEAFAFFQPFLLTICFMHAKNVLVSDVKVPEKLRKKHAKAGKIVHDYKVLEIKQIKRMLAAAKTPGESGIKLALHRCRGHFKTYTEEKPLLGRAVGTYFWDEHIRGTASKGEIQKDYNVHPSVEK